MTADRGAAIRSGHIMGALLETIKTGLMGFDGRRRPSHANNQLPLIWENGTRENVRNDGVPSVTSDSGLRVVRAPKQCAPCQSGYLQTCASTKIAVLLCRSLTSHHGSLFCCP